MTSRVFEFYVPRADDEVEERWQWQDGKSQPNTLGVDEHETSKLSEARG